MAKRKKSSSETTPIEQYEHTDKKRVNNPPVGLVTAHSDNGGYRRKQYAYDPHIDPKLDWCGKAEHTSFDVPTVSLHVHERIDPRRIIEELKKAPEDLGTPGNKQGLLFESDVKPLRQAVEFYKHKENWSNRLVAGDSLLVMNSLLEKEAMAGKVQMIYFDPPYGIKYGSNFQPFVNKRDVKDGKDEDLTAEPEMIKAFRDTWELGIHSYLTYIRDRLLLAREMLHESGSVFVQISDENVHRVRCLMDEVFGAENFVSMITFRKKNMPLGAKYLEQMFDYILWYANDKNNVSFVKLFVPSEIQGDAHWNYVELNNGQIVKLTREQIDNHALLPEDSRIFRFGAMFSAGTNESGFYDVELDGDTYKFPKGKGWKTPENSMKKLIEIKRVIPWERGETLGYRIFHADYPVTNIDGVWNDTALLHGKQFVVQTSTMAIQRCMLMTTDPGDLVLDITCGSGTTAYVAENWGRRWITCDTSRVAITLAKQRLMTAQFDYFELAHPNEGVRSGFRYKTVPHVTLKSIANNEPAPEETLYDQPYIDRKKIRITGPFTVEAVPAPSAVASDESSVASEGSSGELSVASGEKVEAESHHSPQITNHYSLTTPHTSIARSGETIRQSDWKDELLRTGVRGKKGQKIEFTRVESLSGTKFLQAEAETKDSAQRVLVCFGPEHAPLEQRAVELALEEAQHLKPTAQIILFCAFQFDEEAAKDIDETTWPGVTLLKAQMNADLLTDDLKKKRSSNESFWLIGQPDVEMVSEEWLATSEGEVVCNYEYFKIVSGLNRLEKINRLGWEDLLFYAAISQRGDLRIDLADAKSSGVHREQYRRGTGSQLDGRVSPISRRFQGVFVRIGNTIDHIAKSELSLRKNPAKFIERLRRDQQIAQWIDEIVKEIVVASSKLRATSRKTAGSSHTTDHSPLTTRHYSQVTVRGFDYYDPKKGELISGGPSDIAMWMLDADYDGRSLYPSQVFFPMAGAKDGWSALAKSLKAELDEEKIESFRGTVSLPFTPGKAVAVKIIDARGIESLKILR